MADHWQICFDNGHQQRYLPDRQSVLRYVLAIGPHSPSTRFEVFEAAPVRQADGSPGGRSFALVEVIDLAVPGAQDRLEAELASLSGDAGRPGSPGDRDRTGTVSGGSSSHGGSSGRGGSQP
jgi:hypothetical protein